MKGPEENSDSIDINPYHDYLSEMTAVPPNSSHEAPPTPNKQGCPEQPEKIASFKTAKGSVYTYLPDGRTQRFKAVENNLEAPQDMIVFIPQWDTIAEEMKRIFPQAFGRISNNLDFLQILLSATRVDDYRVVVGDENGNEVRTSEELSRAQKPLLYFMDRTDPKRFFCFPVSKTPRVGYSTFDSRYYKDDAGKTMHETHIGNEVSEITYLSNPNTDTSAE